MGNASSSFRMANGASYYTATADATAASPSWPTQFSTWWDKTGGTKWLVLVGVIVGLIILLVITGFIGHAI